MAKKLIFTQMAGPEDYASFERTFFIGEAVYEFTGHTYGIVHDDAIYGNRATIACTENENGEGPFFTVPVEWLRYYDTGKEPICDYLTREQQEWQKPKN
jgi:hypothetical protein